jgi:hypothetical protein
MPRSTPMDHGSDDAFAIENALIVNVKTPKGSKCFLYVVFRDFSEAHEHGKRKHFTRAFIQPIGSICRQM